VNVIGLKLTIEFPETLIVWQKFVPVDVQPWLALRKKPTTASAGPETLPVTANVGTRYPMVPVSPASLIVSWSKNWPLPLTWPLCGALVLKSYDEEARKFPPVASALPETVPENKLLDPTAGPEVDWLRIVQGEPLLQYRTVSLIEAAKVENGAIERANPIQPASFIGNLRKRVSPKCT
jgi:hypothetical protein